MLASETPRAVRESSISLPRPPEVPAARRFPLVATIAPVVASLVLFAVTRSSFMLVFALLGPVVAIASTVDAALHRRGARRSEARRFTAELAAAAAAIDRAHGVERAELDRRHPSVRAWLDADRFDTDRAGSDRPESHQPEGNASTLPPYAVGRDALAVRVGSGVTQSATVIGRPAPGVGATAYAGALSQLDELEARACRLTAAPVVLAVGSVIRVAGGPAIALPVARAIVLQLVARVAPRDARVEAPADAEWDWLVELPHSVVRSGQGTAIRVVGESVDVRIAVDDGGDAGVGVGVGVGVGIGIVLAGGSGRTGAETGSHIRVRGDGTALLDSASHNSEPFAPEFAPEFVPEFVSVESALLAARRLRTAAERAGDSSSRAIPDSVAFSELVQAPAGGSREPATWRGLSAILGRAADGPVLVDLVGDGPHAIVGGTTGSGKSELLVTWVLAMAATRSPAEVTFLFVDFKGGAAFDPLLPLPHSVGVITDLDAEQSLRALASLGAELRHRERVLASLGARSLDDAAGHPPFPRLVVLVDEYAALLETHSGLHTVFADIAARGRSLGVHLVLCTQRPAGVVRDAILANAPLRLSLRVMAVADSTAVLGTDAAARLPARLPGRALVTVAGDPPQQFQVAHSDADDVATIVARWDGAEPPRASWLPPLPSRVGLDRLAKGPVRDGIPFGIADRPEHQVQDAAVYRPAEHGSLLVVGGPRAGKSGVLGALEAAPTTTRVVRLPTDVPGLWDAVYALDRYPGDRLNDGTAGVTRTAEDAGSSAPGRLLLIDDLDAIVASCDENYRPELIERLVRVLREGPAVGIHLAITVQRISGPLQQVAALTGSLLSLRMPSRQEYVLAGGTAAEFSDRMPAGGGHWRGSRVQVFATGMDDGVRAAEKARLTATMSAEVTVLDLATAALAVVSTRPERFAAAVRTSAPWRHVIVLGATPPAGTDELTVHAGGAPAIVVADPDTWQAQWALLATGQRASGILFDGCSLADLRAITRSRELPPPFARGERPLWLHTRDGGLVRAKLPEPQPQPEQGHRDAGRGDGGEA